MSVFPPFVCPPVDSWRDIPRLNAAILTYVASQGREFNPAEGFASCGLFTISSTWDLTHPSPEEQPADWNTAPSHGRNTGPTRAVLTPQSTKLAIRLDDEAREIIRGIYAIHALVIAALLNACCPRIRSALIDSATQMKKPEYAYVYQILDYLQSNEIPPVSELQAFALEAERPFPADPAQFETAAAARLQLFAELASHGHIINDDRQLQILNAACSTLPFFQRAQEMHLAHLATQTPQGKPTYANVVAWVTRIKGTLVPTTHALGYAGALSVDELSSLRALLASHHAPGQPSAAAASVQPRRRNQPSTPSVVHTAAPNSKYCWYHGYGGHRGDAPCSAIQSSLPAELRSAKLAASSPIVIGGEEGSKRVAKFSRA
jgi:hypothetical protein